jgi:hypothetical protein
MLRVAVEIVAAVGVALVGLVGMVVVVLVLVHREVTVAVEQTEMFHILAVEAVVSVAMDPFIQETTEVRVELVLFTLL